MNEVKVAPFKGTKEQEAELKTVIDKYRDTNGALIPILHEAQEIYGYLPLEVQKIISEELNISMAEIYGVVTFYTQFSLYPKGEYKIGVCLGTACYVKGSGEILEKIKRNLNMEVGTCSEDGRFSIEMCIRDRYEGFRKVKHNAAVIAKTEGFETHALAVLDRE